MKLYGLIGKKLSHSFSKNYFTKKFEKEGLTDHEYHLFELENISEIRQILERPTLAGLNVTIPYKTAVIPFLDTLDPRAERIGAVNVIAPREGKFTGFNSDYYGFRKSLEPWMGPALKSVRALILGTGGASRAVKVVLDDLNVPCLFVSRNPQPGHLGYNELNDDVLRSHHLIINTTPVGMSPDEQACPEIPYSSLGPNHYLYDLVYNPERTLFMQKGELSGARTMNGLEMLYLQAEASWSIWNE